MKYQELLNEYSALLSKRNEHLAEIDALKDGYLSTKIISGKKYSYLQKRAGDKMVSEYIKKSDVAQLKYDLKKRKEAKKEVRQIDVQLSRLEAAAKALDKNIYETFVVLRQASPMDSLSMEARKASLAFGNAMAALEGLPISKDTETNLSLWANGQHSFQESFLRTLAKYNLIGKWQ